MNNMFYPYMNDNMMNQSFQYNKIIELEQRINRIEKDLHKVGKRLNNIENQKTIPLTSNIDINDSSNLYMV